jgi:hypothetical protein
MLVIFHAWCAFKGGEAPPSHFSSRIQGDIQAFNEDKMEEKDIPSHKMEVRSPLIGWQHNGSASDSEQIAIIVIYPFDKY